MLFTNKLFRIFHMQNETFFMMITAILTAIASEFKVVPFNGEFFRFGLGSVTFFLLILIRPPLSIIRTGVVTGITVVCFRFLEDILFGHKVVMTSIIEHLPAFLFYFIYSWGLQVIKVERFKTNPLLLGAWASLFELLGNAAEHMLRITLYPSIGIEFWGWALLVGVALLRSYFVIGLYSSITVSEQKKRIEEMLQVGSELYAETLYLKKSMNHIEQITASSHDLYRKLKKEEKRELSSQALLIAQEIHEVKKDSQRILAGLTKISERREKQEELFLSEILNLVVISNEKYSEWLKKDIVFRLAILADFQTELQIPLLSVLNNITANAVESITDNGEIQIDLFEESTNTVFMIKDTGKGIPKEDVGIIFEPGYTTKYNQHGVAATGIGLSHVQEIVRTLEGKVQIQAQDQGTVFTIYIPTNKLRK